MQRVIAIFRTYRDSEAATREYYCRLSPEERLEILLELRAWAHGGNHAASERVERVYRIAELPWR